ncbi:MAG: ribose-phosphate pyrophosphokinase [Desulfohalobiaceae bacterium]|nr:ribose-phosphate pyrophosphokinase [Desulfohalobiaceae bacterium]
MTNYNDLKLITGNSNPALARAIADNLGCSLTPTVVESFSDGEIKVEIGDNVRGSDLFVVQSTCGPVNTNIMELCLMIDALKRASANRITAVVPYYGYARQDRKVVPRVPISAKMVADFISTAGASRLLTVDLHAGQIQGFFDLPVDNLYASKVLLDFLEGFKDNLVIISPDAGGTERARAYAKRLGAGLAIVDKRRDAPNKAEAMNVIGDVQDKCAIIVDDMIDTAGTLVTASKVLQDKGAKSVMACASHPVLSGPAMERIENSELNRVIVTDTIPLSPEARQNDKIQVVSVAGLLGQAISNIHQEASVSVLFS